MNSAKTFFANGKLLLTAEYFILDGAKGIALPTKFHQKLQIEPITSQLLKWNSFDENNQIWFSCIFDKNLVLIEFSDEQVAIMLQKILKTAQSLNQAIFVSNISVATHLNFNRQFGLGTSSTLISLIAQWFEVNPYQLLEKTFGGSGYDIACATAEQPILFYRNANHQPIVEKIEFNPPFKENLFFVYLNQKQNSREGIKLYREKNNKNREQIIEQLNQLTILMINAKNISTFKQLIDEHENIVSSFLSLKKIKDEYFSDFNGSVKSLGAWGGDFILVSGLDADYIQKYFKNKGYNNIIPYINIIKD